MTPRKAHRRLLVLLQLVALILLGGMAPASADSALPENKVPGAVESKARRVANTLRQQGFEVARGYFKLYTQDDCPSSYEVLRSCLGNNPAAPYVLPVLPAWPDEWVDPATAGIVGTTVEGFNASYRLDPREAIVIVGQLPPPASYFGLQTYLLSRPGEWNADSYQYAFVRDHVPALLTTFFTKLPKNADRLQLFADLSSPINNVVVERGSGAAWDQVRAFVITPDGSLDAAVRQALGRVGLPGDGVFTEQIPSTLGGLPVNVGLDEASDDFLTVLRYAMPDDGGTAGTPSAAWRANLPLVVLRVRDTRPDAQPQPYGPAVFEARSGTTPPETALASDLVTLAKAVCADAGQPCDLEGAAFEQRAPRLLNMRTGLLMTGPECVQVGMNCLAPTEDTAYFMSARLPLPDNRVYALAGALGTMTGNATYVGLGLNASLTQLGFDNIDDEALAGTASGFGVPNSDRFYVQYFARDCTAAGVASVTGGGACYSVGDQLPTCADVADLSCSMLVLSVRNYLLPCSQRGPAANLTLAPRLIPLTVP